MSKQREALFKCLSEGGQDNLLQVIWRSDDLGTIRDAVRMLDNIPEPYKSKFNSALKQMSG